MVKMAEIVKVKKPTYPLTFRTFVLHLYLETYQSGHMRKSRRPPTAGGCYPLRLSGLCVLIAGLTAEIFKVTWAS
jgi:hypothetical protein